MRKDDWITELYYKQLSDKIRNNRDSGKAISSKKEISRTQDQFTKEQFELFVQEVKKGAFDKYIK